MTKSRTQRIFSSLLAVLLLAAAGGLWTSKIPSALAQLAPRADRDSAVRAVAQGKAAMESGQPAAAEQAFRQAIALDPANVEAHYRLGNVLIQRNAVEEAFGYLQRSVDLAPENLSLRMSVGNLFEQFRQIDRALVHYRFVADKAPKTPEGIEAEKRLNLALVKDYAAKGDLDTSLQLLQSLVEDHPDDTRVLQHLGFAYFLARRYEPAIAVYQEVIEREPNSDTAYLNIANVYEQMGDYPHAIDALEKVIELVPQGPKNTEARVRSGLLRAFQAMRQNAFDEAKTHIDNVLKVAPDNPIANSLAGDVFKQQGKLDEAQAVWESVLRVMPNNLDTRLKLGTLFLDRNNYVDAVWELDRIVRDAPNSPQGGQAAVLLDRLTQTFGNQLGEMRAVAANKNTFKSRLLMNASDVEAQFNLGVIYMQQGLFDQALSAFEAVRTLDPTIARTYLNLARINTQISKFEPAADAMATYIALEPSQQDVESITALYANILGSLLYERGQFKPAYDQFQRLVALTPNDPAAHFYSGVILARLGQMDEAVRAYEKVMELAPNHLGARQQLAFLYEQTGKEQEALTEYKRIALSTEDAEARRNAEKRAVALQRSLNGVTTNIGYSIGLDSNSNYSATDPQEEYTGNMSFNLTYRYKYSERVRFGMVWSPSYVTYHRGNYDFLNELYNPFMTYGDPTDLYTFRYTYNKLSGVLLEQNVNETHAWSVDRSWDTVRNERLSYSLSMRDYVAATTDIFDTTTYTLSGSLSRTLARGYGDVFTASLSSNINKTDSNAAAAFDSLTFGYQGSKWISADLFAGFTASLGYTRYRNEDVYAQINNFANTIRENFNYSVSTSLNYRMNDDIRFYASVSYQENDSNLPVFKCRQFINDVGQAVVECVPLTSEDFIGVAVQNASLGDFSKTQVTVGLTVNF